MKGKVMLENWLQDFTKKINESFPKRIIFIGIQGSYARGEATENSDIDVVVIFDKLIYSDIWSSRGSRPGGRR